MTNRHEGPSSGEDLAVSQSQPISESVPLSARESEPSAAGEPGAELTGYFTHDGNGSLKWVPRGDGDSGVGFRLAPTEAVLGRLQWYAENPASEALQPGLAADVRDVLKMLSGARAHLAVALNAAKAALPVYYALRDRQYNVETWGLHGRIAALEAALDYGPPQ